MNYLNIEWWQVLIGSTFRYVFFAGLAYALFYVWKRNPLRRFKIQKRFPQRSAIRTEVLYSLSTIVIFGVVIYASVFSPLRSYTQLYNDVHAHSWGYYAFTLFLTVILHDTYFYWMHRLMHWKKIFKFVHHVHHQSHNPTPLAAFSFHPFEALIEVAILPLMVFTIPMHTTVIGLFGMYMLIMNVMGHLGFELLPSRFIQHPVLRWFNTSTHHNMHHHYGRSNYGLYFNFWDRLFGTNHERYEQEIAKTREREKPEHVCADSKLIVGLRKPVVD